MLDFIEVLSQKVAERVASKVSSEVSGPQDAFQSVGTAAEALVKGGKKRKTRRKRIFNKNKSKKLYIKF